MPKNKCIFSDAWLNGSRFSEWLKRTHSKWKAYCTDCKKSFEISNMGVASLLSHASGKKIQIQQHIFLEILVQENHRKPIRKETWQGSKIKLKKHWTV